MVAYFFDTYALAEIEKGNLNYKPYLKAEVITTKLNLMEFYSSILADFDEKTADEKFGVYADSCVPIADEDIKHGVKFRMQMRNEDKKCNLSFVDAIGYIIALKLEIKFLTGDKAFRDLKNVEFVK